MAEFEDDALGGSEWAAHPLNRFRGWLAAIIVLYLVVGVLGAVSLFASALDGAPLGPGDAPLWANAAASAAIFGHSVLALWLIGTRAAAAPFWVAVTGAAAMGALLGLELFLGEPNWLDAAVGLIIVLGIGAYLRWSPRGQVMFARRA